LRETKRPAGNGSHRLPRERCSCKRQPVLALPGPHEARSSLWLGLDRILRALLLRLNRLRRTSTPRPSRRASFSAWRSLRAGRCLDGVRAAPAAVGCGQAFLARRTCAHGTPAAPTVAPRGTPQPAQAPRAVARFDVPDARRTSDRRPPWRCCRSPAERTRGVFSTLGASSVLRGASRSAARCRGRSSPAAQAGRYECRPEGTPGGTGSSHPES
jgi:hypothetical protein